MKKACSVLLCLALMLALFAGCREADKPVAEVSGTGGNEVVTDLPTTAPPETERPLTAEEVLAGMAERLSSAKSLRADLDVEFHMSTGPEGKEEALSIRFELPAELTLEPLAFRGSGRAVLEMPDEPEEMSDELSFELCALQEDEKLAVYVRSEGEEVFERLTVALPAFGELPVSGELPAPMEAAWNLDRSETEYTLTYVISAEDSARLWEEAKKDLGDKALQALKRIGFDPDQMFQEVLTGTSMRIRVDRETLEPREITVEVNEGLKNFIAGIMKQTLEPSDEPVTVISDIGLRYSILMHDFDTVDPIAAPDAFEDVGDLGLPADGNFFDFDGQTGLTELDDSFTLGDYSFHAMEITPRDLAEHGWVPIETRIIEPQKSPEPGTDADPTEDTAPAEDAAPALVPPLGHITSRLRPADSDSEFCPMVLQAVNNGSEPAEPWDCTVTAIALNWNDTPITPEIKAACVPFTGPDGIRSGMSEEEVRELLGVPYASEENEDGSSLSIYLNGQQATLLYFDESGSLLAILFGDLSGISVLFS